MSTTVTTTTVSTIVSSATAANLGLMAVLCLIAFLVAKELLDASAEENDAGGVAAWTSAMSRTLTVPIVPLLLVFCAIVAVKVLEVL